MGKCLGIDYGTVRTGIAISDDLGIIAAPMETVATKQLQERLKHLVERYKVSTIVIGEARYLNGDASSITELQQKFATHVQKTFPQLEVVRENEMFTSQLASQALFASGRKKSDRAKKENVDMVSAAILLQAWLDRSKR